MAESLPSRRERLTEAVARANRRYVPWLSLVAGAAAALLWREGVDQVRAFIVLASLAGTVTLLLLFPPWGDVRLASMASREWVSTAAWWTTMKLARSAVWFVIPFYVLSTSWPSRSVPFTALLVTLGVLSCFDALVRERVLLGGWSGVAFVAPPLLAALQLFLPMLTGIPPRFTIFGAGALAAVASACLVTPDTILRRRPAFRLLAATALVGALAGRVALPLLAPAPLRLASAQFARGRDGLDPVDPVRASRPGDPAPAYVFVAIEAPRGLRENVRLVLDAGGVRETRPLEILGGRSGGYRLWAPVPAGAVGSLSAMVRTEGGQIVGSTFLYVTPSDP